MANTSQLIEQQGRLLAEAIADFFDAATRLYHLNAAYLTMLSRVAEIDPAHLTFRVLTDLVADQSRYFRPDMSAGVSRVIRYDLLCGTGATAEYREIPRLTESQAVPILGDAYTFTSGAQRGNYGYYEQGQEIVIVPTPTTSITNGLQAVCVEELTLSADLDEPRLPLALHHVLAYGGALLAIEESKDADESVVAIWRRRWESVVGPGESSSRESRLALSRHFRHSQPLSLIGPRLGPQ
jgi:hypothetical protein